MSVLALRAFPGVMAPGNAVAQHKRCGALEGEHAKQFHAGLVFLSDASAPQDSATGPGALGRGNGASMSAASLCSCSASRLCARPYDGYRHALIASWACFAAGPSVRPVQH